MSRSKSSLLQLQSLDMAIAAIEIYNKPMFPNRDMIFTILMVNAWESLAKSKVLLDNKNRIRSLYVKDNQNNRYKKNRSGDYMTIGTLDALKKTGCPRVVQENVAHLVDIRGNATHLPFRSAAIPLLVYNLGSASLKSYAILSREWFGVRANPDDFFILPIGFSYPFTTLTSINLNKEVSVVARITREVSNNPIITDPSGLHQLVCEVRVELISSKKIEGEPDLRVSVTGEGDQIFITQQLDLKSRYPYTWHEALSRIQQELPFVTRNKFSKFIQDQSIKGDLRYSSYSYPSLSHQKKGPTNNTTVIYNNDFIALCISHFRNVHPMTIPIYSPELSVSPDILSGGTSVSGS